MFPFCIPFDFADTIKSLVAAPRAPVFEMDFSGVKYFYGYVWRLDMSEYEALAAIVRWSVWISTLIGLMFLTGRVIKW